MRPVVWGSLVLVLAVGCASGQKDEEPDAAGGANWTGGSSGSNTGGMGGAPTTGPGPSTSTGGNGASGGDGGNGAAGGGGGGVGGSGGGTGGSGGAGDTTPPTVMSTAPIGSAIAATPTISVTFSEAMNVASITADTTTTCTGAIQVSADGFISCVAMTGAPTTSDDTTFDLTPAAPLDSATTYDIRVTTSAEDAAQNAMVAPFVTPTGFTVRYAHTIAIDGVNDFDLADTVQTSTTGGTLYFSYDDTHLYVGLESPDIIGTLGSGDKFIYFLFSTDVTLTTGNTRSSDDKAQFGVAGTSRLSYHWKVRIDGVAYEEFRIGNATDWNTDWGSQGKSGFRTDGYFEGSIELAELGNPASLIATSFTIDYDGDNGSGNGWVSNMIFGATDGAAATPRNIYAYGLLALPTSNNPNDLSHLVTF